MNVPITIAAATLDSPGFADLARQRRLIGERRLVLEVELFVWDMDTRLGVFSSLGQRRCPSRLA